MCNDTQYMWTVCGHASRLRAECQLRLYHKRTGWLDWFGSFCIALPPQCEDDKPTNITYQFLYGFCTTCRSNYEALGFDTRNPAVFLNYWAFKREQDLTFPVHSSCVPVGKIFGREPLRELSPAELDQEMREFEMALPWCPGGSEDERIAYLKLLRKLTLGWANGRLDGPSATQLHHIYSLGPMVSGSRQPIKFTPLPLAPVPAEMMRPDGGEPADLEGAVIVSYPSAPAAPRSPSHPVTLEDWEAQRDRRDVTSRTESIMSDADFTVRAPPVRPSCPSPETEMSTPQQSPVMVNSVPSSTEAPRPRANPGCFRKILDTGSLSPNELPDPDGFEIPESPEVAELPRGILLKTFRQVKSMIAQGGAYHVGEASSSFAEPPSSYVARLRAQNVLPYPVTPSPVGEPARGDTHSGETDGLNEHRDEELACQATVKTTEGASSESKEVSI